MMTLQECVCALYENNASEMMTQNKVCVCVCVCVYIVSARSARVSL